MPDMDLGDVTIHYEEAGDGPLAYVFCHGVGSDSTFGSEFVDQFDFWKAKLGRVVTWDNRGMGRSSQAADYSLPLYASDLARLLDGLGIAIISTNKGVLSDRQCRQLKVGGELLCTVS